jgi:hypothetical protein
MYQKSHSEICCVISLCDFRKFFKIQVFYFFMHVSSFLFVTNYALGAKLLVYEKFSSARKNIFFFLNQIWTFIKMSKNEKPITFEF